MKVLILCFIILISIDLKGQNKIFSESDSILYKRLEKLDSDYDSIQNRLNYLQLLFDSLTIRDDSINNLILQGPKISSYEDYKFENWLKKFGLTSRNFGDTVIHDAFELWTSKETFTDINNTLKIPSPNSSYSLLTNFDKNNIPTIKDLVFFKFLNNNSQKVYIGVVFLENRSYEILDYHWFDKNTIFILDKYENGIYELRKLMVGVNKLWIYKTRKINAP